MKPLFVLPGVDGEKVALTPGKSGPLTVLCFLGTECPLARLYAPRLEAMSQQFKKQNVEFIAISSNVHDSMEELKKYAALHQLSIPLGKDYGNRVADHFKAKRTPEVVVLDQQWNVLYQGRIDDQYLPGISKKSPSRNDLEIAIQEILDGKKVSVPKTEAVGCIIGRSAVSDQTPTTTITYSKEVSRILQKHCVECHRAGEIGPFALQDFEEIVGWGEMIVEVVDQGRMPPWHANPKHGKFANSRLMTEKEKRTLREWVAGGMPLGNPNELPEPVSYVEGWNFKREPDEVFKMGKTPFKVPEEGTVDYQYYVVDPRFKEDKWVSAAQVIPGNRAVVHHCIVFIRPPDGTEFRGMGWISGYVPGQRSTTLPKGYARKVPAGSHFVFQMHYTPNGSEQVDTTQLGLIYEDEKEVTHELTTMLAINQEFEIPPFAEKHPVSATLNRFPVNGKLLAITPHMHYRGTSIRVSATSAGKKEIILDVPQYDFNWQHVYEQAEPLSLDQIESLSFVAHFDNSKKNPFNPDPSQYVTWGDQSDEEMAIAFFEIAFPKGKKKLVYRSKKKEAPKQSMKGEKVKEFVDQFFARFDTNQNGEILKNELPVSLQRFGFRKLDSDRNGYLDRKEIARLANSRSKL